jgi:hypothetical protein
LKKILLYSLAAALGLTASIVVLAPAAPAWKLLSGKVNVPNFSVLQVHGTIWNGQAGLQYQQFPTSLLTWQLDPLALVSGTIDIAFHIAGDGHDFKGEARINSSGFNVSNLRGFMHSRYMNTVSQPQGLTFSGEIKADNVSFVSDWIWFNEAEGHIYWPGGRIVSVTPAGSQVLDLPSLDGDIGLVEDRVQLLIHYQQAGLIDIQVKSDGWIIVAVKARLFDLAQLPFPAGMNLQDTVLEFEEKIL